MAHRLINRQLSKTVVKPARPSHRMRAGTKPGFNLIARRPRTIFNPALVRRGVPQPQVVLNNPILPTDNQPNADEDYIL